MQGDRGSPPRVMWQNKAAEGVSLPSGLATMGGWGLFFYRGRARLSRFETVANQLRSKSGFFVFSHARVRPLT